MKIQQPRLISTKWFKKEAKTGGSHPCLFYCDDGNFYFVKYHDNRKLINEFIGAQLLKLLDINVPDWALVQINPNSIMPDTRFFGRAPSGIGFGSKEFTSFRDFYDLMSPKGKGTKQFILDIRRTFLQIVLFDIWVRNCDRTINNTNLLIVLNEKESYQLYAIDHADILAQLDYMSLSLEKETDIPIEDTLIYRNSFFKNIETSYGLFFDEEIDRLVQEIKNIDEDTIINILNLVPESWSLNNEGKRSIIDFLIFRKDITKEQFYKLLKESEQ